MAAANVGGDNDSGVMKSKTQTSTSRSPQRQEEGAKVEEEEEEYHILSIDGGGSRGVMEAFLLQDIMRLATVIKREPEILFNLLFEDKDKEKEEPSLGSKDIREKLVAKLKTVADPIEPAHVFDLIAGTSTGALISFGLVYGKEGGPMKVREVIDMYREETKKIFQKNKEDYPGWWHWWQWTKAAANGLALWLSSLPAPVPYSQKGLGELLVEKFGAETTLNSFPESGCRAAAVARQFNEDSGDPDVLEIFDTIGPRRSTVSHKVVEVLKASACAPLYFDTPTEVSGKRYVDGGVGGNCPLIMAIPRMQEVHGDKKLGFVLSVAPPVRKMEKSLGDFKKYEQMSYWIPYFPDNLSDGFASYEATRKNHRDGKFVRVNPRSPRTQQFKMDEMDVCKMIEAMETERLDETMSYFENLLIPATMAAMITLNRDSRSPLTGHHISLIHSVAMQAMARHLPTQATYLLERLLKQMVGDSLWVAQTDFLLGRAYDRLRKFDQAKKYYEQAREVHRRLHNSVNSDENDLGKAEVLCNLGCHYQDACRYEEAIQCSEQCCRIYEANGTHSKLVYPLNNLGICYHELKDDEKAIECYEKALKIIEKYSSRNQRETATIKKNLAATKSLKGSDEALEELLSILEVEEKQGTRFEVASSLTTIGNSYVNRKNYEEAENFLQRSLEIEKEIHKENPDHPKVAASINNLARCLAKQQGKIGEAKVMFEKCRNIQKVVYGKISHLDMLATHHNIGKCCKELGQYEEAVENYKECVRITEDVFRSDPEHEMLKESLAALAQCHEDFARRSVKAAEAAGNNLEAAKNYWEAAGRYQRAVGIRKEMCPGKGNPEVAQVLSGMARCMALAGQVPLAKGLYQECREILERLRDGSSGGEERRRYQKSIDDVNDNLNLCAEHS